METENKTAMAILPETKEVYEAPVIQTVEVRVEQGFQISGPGEIDDDPSC